MAERRRIVIGLDQGTTNTKAVALDPDGRVLGKAARPIATAAPRPGWVEQDPLAMLDNAVACVQALLEATGRRPGEVAGLGIANQTETLVVWERASGAPVMPAILWQCRRGEAEIAPLREGPAPAIVRSRTGLDLDPTFTAAKLTWLWRHRPAIAEGLRRGAYLFGTVDCWLVWKLTGGACYATEAGNAARTMLFDIDRLAWDEELRALFGIAPAALPELRPSAGPFGHVAAAFLGEPVPITAVLGDQQASLFGHGCFAEGEAKVTYGTGAFLWANAGSGPRGGVAGGLLRTIAWQLDTPCYALEGFAMYAGAILEWLAGRLRIEDGGAGVAERAREAGQAEGVILVPAFQGLAAPWWRPDARAALLGMSHATSVGQICHAGLEAIGYQLRALLALLEESGARPAGALRVDGGPTRSAYLMRLQADILQTPLAVSTVEAMAAYGVALMAGLGSGLWPDLEALRRILPEAVTVVPDPARAAGWAAAYGRWRAATEALLAPPFRPAAEAQP